MWAAEGRRNFQQMIISGGKGPKIVREMEKRCQDLRRKLINKGGVRLINNISSSGLLTLCVHYWPEKGPYFWSSVHLGLPSEAHHRCSKNSTSTQNFTHGFCSFLCATGVSPGMRGIVTNNVDTGWAAWTCLWMSENGIAWGAMYRRCTGLCVDEKGVAWQARPRI